MTPYRVAILALGLAGCAWFSTSPSQEPKPTAPAAVEPPPVASKPAVSSPPAASKPPAASSSRWGVGEYRVKQLKAREDAASAALYTPDQGVVTTIESVSATPKELRPGEPLNLRMEYTVLAPPQMSDVKIREVRSIFFNNQHLVDLAPKELTLRQGTNEIHDTLTLPANAAAGSYAVVTSLQVIGPGGWRQVRGQASFAVSSRGTPAPAEQPATSKLSAPPAPSPVSRPPTSTVAVPPQAPSVMHVQIPMANLREGAGVKHAILGRIPRGTKIDVLETRGPDNDRWFRVRAPGGQEGWVAASALSP